MACSSISRFSVAVAMAVMMAMPPPASARQRHHRRAQSVTRAAARAAPPTAPMEAQSQPPLDDLYRRRGYGIGGPVFGGDTALAGSCADLRFAQPAACGRGYGIYGNGLGARFGH